MKHIYPTIRSQRSTCRGELFLSSKFDEKVPEGSTLIFGVTRMFNSVGIGSLRAKNQLDPFGRSLPIELRLVIDGQRPGRS